MSKIVPDEQQQKAITTLHERVFVAARPGSGKTLVLTEHVRYMVNELGIQPSTIAVMTFTRMAGKEIKRRLGPIGKQLYFAGTIHAFCLPLIQRFGQSIGWEWDWLTMLDEQETELDEREALQECGVITGKGGKWAVPQEAWEAYRKACMTAGGVDNARLLKVIKDSGYPIDSHQNALLRSAFDRYVNRLRAENCMTFDLLMRDGIRVAPHLKGVLHLVVDEVQDCNDQQWELMWALGPLSMYLVGDHNQAIYAWNGARPDLALDFAKSEDVRTYAITRTYRFGKNIAEPANRLIQHNAEGKGSYIESADYLPPGGVEALNGISHDELALKIKALISEGVKPSEIAVLARTHMTLEFAARALLLAEVPHVKIGGKSDVTKMAEYRAVKGYLRLMVNPKDRRAFMSIAGAEGISTHDLLHYREQAMKRGTSLLEESGLKMPLDFDELQDRMFKKGPEFIVAMAAVARVREVEGLLDLHELSLYLSMEHATDKLQAVGENVALMTCHSSKGLQWPHVFVIGLNAKDFPSPMAIREGRMDEDRRLAYVAVTRAEQHLYLATMKRTKPEDAAQSVFMTEMGLAFEKATDGRTV